MNLVADVDIREMVTLLFQLDVLLPAQYLEKNKKIEAMPEKTLMLAVLEDAVYCFQKYLLVPDKRGKILFKEAERWLFDDDDRDVFSYRNVCEILGIDADYLRLGLLRWKEKRLACGVYKVKKKHRIQGV
jgi:hypothetical protein